MNEEIDRPDDSGKDDSWRADHDGAWKESLTTDFPEMLAILFPLVAEAIDWDKGTDFLDKEFRQISRGAKWGKRLADVFVRVWLCDGSKAVLHIHVEVQGQRELAFPERMFVYNTRGSELAGEKVLSLAILADSSHQWRPYTYTREVLGCRTTFTFPIAKILDWQGREDELEQRGGIAAMAILSQLYALEAAGNSSVLLDRKIGLVRNLYQRGYSREQIEACFRLIDWMLHLPKPEALTFRSWHIAYEEDLKMPYVTSIERLAREEGLEQGLEQGRLQLMLKLLRNILGELPDPVTDDIAKLDAVGLETLADQFLNFRDLSELRHWLSARKN